MRALWNDSDVSLDSPSQKHLASSLVMLLCHGLDKIVFKQWLGGLASFIQGYVGIGTKGGVSGNLNALGLDPFDQSLLGKIRMNFH